MTEIFTGFAVADGINAATRDRAAALPRRPNCTVFWNAGDPAMRAFIERQREFADRAGINLHVEPYPDDTADFRAKLQQLASDSAVDAISTLYPLPAGIEPCEVAGLVGAARDVDGLHPVNAGLLALGAPCRAPATAHACIVVAQHLLGPLEGADVAIVGASSIVGRPLAAMLLDAGATVSVCHVATDDLAGYTSRADLVVTAVGAPGLIGADHVRDGAIIIDVGIVRTENGLIGDVDCPAVEGKAAVVTHAPDGVGPVTTACLFANVVDAAAQRHVSAATVK